MEEIFPREAEAVNVNGLFFWEIPEFIVVPQANGRYVLVASRAEYFVPKVNA